MDNNEFRARAAKRLRFFRTLKGVSAKQMSLDIGKSEGYINSIENEKVLPSVDGFADIVKYIGITCDLFFQAKI